MKILYICSFYKPAYVYGGPINSIANMCEALARQGAQVTVLTTNANGGKSLDVPLNRPMDVDGVSVHYYPITPGWPHTYFYSPALGRACETMVKAHDIAVLETLFTHPTGPAVQACKKTRTPYIIPLRGSLLPWALRQKSFKKQLYMTLAGRRYLNGAAAVQCSDKVEFEALQSLKLKTPAYIIPNGVATSQWQDLPLRGTLRQQLRIPAQARVLLMLGRLHRVKNPELAVEMLGLLQHSDTHLIFAGPDEEGYQPRLQARANTLGCGARIHFTGLLAGQSLLQALADADLLVMPSVMESFGMAAVEAMSAGLPVLLSEHVPVGRWIDEAGAGRQVACTAEGFASACDAMLFDEQARREMGLRARALATQRFDTSVIAKQMLAQCREILLHGKPLSDQQDFLLAKV
jgi:glycosyltransferase involved in cell wall biosynthesis